MPDVTRQISVRSAAQGGYSMRALPGPVEYGVPPPQEWLYAPESLDSMQALGEPVSVEFVNFSIPGASFVESLSTGPTGGTQAVALEFTELAGVGPGSYTFARRNAAADARLAVTQSAGFTLEAYFSLSHGHSAFSLELGASGGIVFVLADVLSTGEGLISAVARNDYTETAADIALGQFHHLSLSVDGLVGRLFLNGVQVGANWSIDANVYALAFDRFLPFVAYFGDSRNVPPYPGLPTNPPRTVKGHFMRFTPRVLYTGNFTPPTFEP